MRAQLFKLKAEMINLFPASGFLSGGKIKVLVDNVDFSQKRLLKSESLV